MFLSGSDYEGLDTPVDLESTIGTSHLKYLTLTTVIGLGGGLQSPSMLVFVNEIILLCFCRAARCTVRHCGCQDHLQYYACYFSTRVHVRSYRRSAV